MIWGLVNDGKCPVLGDFEHHCQIDSVGDCIPIESADRKLGHLPTPGTPGTPVT